MTDAVARLIARPKFGSGVGLHRMERLLAPILASDWGRSLSAIKVTGSNGKGSVARLAASILTELGLSTGLYTSPHLLRFNERIECDGQAIPDDALEAALTAFLADEQRMLRDWPDEQVGAFEAFTCIAMRRYAERRPQALVLEAGIGGRLDATRAIPGDVVALTSVDLEHTDILGATVELIAYDKADLCPEGGTLVVGALTPDLRRRLDAYARLRRLELIAWDDVGNIDAVRLSPDGMTADLTLFGVPLNAVAFSLIGEHQIVNALVAAGAVRRRLERDGRTVAADDFAAAFRRAVAAARWPGRLERINADPPVFIDVGHTPEAMGSTLAALPRLAGGRKVLMVCGVSYNKNADGIVAALVPHADEMICTRAHHRGGDPRRVAQAAKAARPDLPLTMADDLPQAMAQAIARARAADMPVLVVGGLFLAVEAAAILRGEDEKALRFF
jgi:dihydrofolate synthase / folylpolyglutamate synthase